ncbi:MAG: DUF5615 family PIN-like protein [Actinobacteria bacterium]|nr:DUF5615 family PIN-like protein [Actinomycetota bacterium]
MARFLVDQQLPSKLASHLASRGHDATQDKDHPGGTTLPDTEVIRIADAEGRVVVTKDDDFRISYVLSARPAGLLHVTCGNISTPDLLADFDRNHDILISALADYAYVEINRAGIVVHDPG